jgi:hypothetical protein
MNIAKCRGLSAFTRLCKPYAEPYGWIAVRTISTSRVTFKTKRKAESIDFDALPKTKSDTSGTPVKPLEPWNEYRKAHQTHSADVGQDEEMIYRDAVAAGDIPDTALAKQVYLNWKRFPGCIIITRVGKFYEVCPPHFETIADLVVIFRTCCPIIFSVEFETGK